MWELRENDKELERNLRDYGQTPLFARLLSQRNIFPAQVNDFVNASYENLTDPYLLPDMEKAVELFSQTVEEKGTTAIIGDYDCDGVLSSTMLRELCDTFDLKCDVFLPSRLDHGYGLNPKSLAAYFQIHKEPVDLLIIVDCGTNSRYEVDQLRESGIKRIIVIDHHLAGKVIADNADALINWHFGDNLDDQCSTALVFQLARALQRKIGVVKPLELLTYAAMGVVADISPIVGNNRILVRNGLNYKTATYAKGKGLISLIEKRRIPPDQFTQDAVAFRIGPTINAAGRVFHPDIAFHTMIDRDKNSALESAGLLVDYNKQRQALQQRIEMEAEYSAENVPNSHGIMIRDKEWHHGVVGIVASRIVEKFHKPTIVVGYHNGEWKGSGRSPEGINVKAICDQCSDLFEKYGGHEAAVGVTVKPDRINDAAKVFNESAKQYMETHTINVSNVKKYDADLKFSSINRSTAKDMIDKLYPYCKSNNPEPIFCARDVIVSSFNATDGPNWRMVRFLISEEGGNKYLSVMKFSKTIDSRINGKKVDLYFTFPQNVDDPDSPYADKFELSAVDVVIKGD